MLLTATRTSARCQSAKRIEFRGQDAISRTQYTVGIFKKELFVFLVQSKAVEELGTQFEWKWAGLAVPVAGNSQTAPTIFF